MSHQDWRDRSAVRSIYCSSRGPKVSSQHPPQLQLPGSDTSGLSGNVHLCAHTQTCSYTQWGTEKRRSLQNMDSRLHNSCRALKKSLYITCFLLHTFIEDHCMRSLHKLLYIRCFILHTCIEIHCMRRLHPILKLWYKYNFFCSVFYFTGYWPTVYL